MDYNFTVVLPVLNELDNLVILLPELEKFGCEIVVCDNGSTDGGLEYVRFYHKRVRISQGWGTVVEAIQRGLTLTSHPKVIIMDSDRSHPTAMVPLLVSALDNYDLVVASRYIKGGQSEDNWKNKVISKSFNILSWLLAPSVEDRASGFWGVRKSAIKSIGIRDTTKPMLEYIVRGRISNVMEIPYTFKPRKSGYSKIGKPILKEFSSLILLYIHKFQRPIKFCLVGGTGALLQLGLLTFFTEITGLFYVMSAVVAIIVATIWNYLWNNFWTFQKKGLV